MSNKAMAILVDLFSSAELDVIKLIHDSAIIRTYQPDSFLCRQGELEDTFYILLEGQVDIYRSAEGQRILLDYFTEGDCFGEMSLILDVPRTADVVASGAVRVMEIDRQNFNDLLSSNNELLLTVVRFLLNRLLTQEDRRIVQLARQKRQSLDAPQVFISYARQNEAFVRKLASGLNHHKINAWVDIHEIEAGKSWARQIGKALDSCELMLLILSETSMNSVNVEDEWNYYLDKSKPIIPVLYERCDVPYRLHKLHYIDFTSETFENGLSQLVANLHQYMNDMRPT